MKRFALALLMAGVSTGSAQPTPQEAAAEVHASGRYGDEVFFPGEGGDDSAFPGERGESAGARRRASGGERQLERYTRGSDGTAPRGSDPGVNLPSLPPGVAVLVKYFAIVLAGLAGVVFIVLVIAAFLRRPPKEDSTPDDAVPEPGALPWHTEDPDSLLRRGDLSDAIVAFLVRALKAAGWKEHERGRTAREVLARVPSEDRKHPPLRAIVSLAEGVRFANVQPTEADVERARELAEAVAA